MKVSDFCTYAPKSPIKAGEAVADGNLLQVQMRTSGIAIINWTVKGS